MAAGFVWYRSVPCRSWVHFNKEGGGRVKERGRGREGGDSKREAEELRERERERGDLSARVTKGLERVLNKGISD